jgi:hypothetical protein
LENKHTFTLGQFFKIASDLRQYVVAKIASDLRQYVVAKFAPGIKNITAIGPNVVIASMAIDPHMNVI